VLNASRREIAVGSEPRNPSDPPLQPLPLQAIIFKCLAPVCAGPREILQALIYQFLIERSGGDCASLWFRAQTAAGFACRDGDPLRQACAPVGMLPALRAIAEIVRNGFLPPEGLSAEERSGWMACCQTFRETHALEMATEALAATGAPFQQPPARALVAQGGVR
jgi:hypothetical protein